MERLGRLLFVLALGSWGGAGAETLPLLVRGELVLPPRRGGTVIERGWLHFTGSDGRSVAATFTQAGTYATRLMPGVVYTVRVRRIGVRVGAQHFRVPGSEFTVEPSTLVVPHQGPPLEPRLVIRQRAGEHRLRVEVETRSGRPVPAARVLAVGVDSRNRFRVPYGIAETDVEGVALFHRLPPGRVQVRLLGTGPYARRPTASATASATVALGARAEESTGFLLLEAGSLQVTVDAAGMKSAPPVSLWSNGAELVAGPRRTPEVGGTSAVYRFHSLAPGRYRAVAHYPDGDPVFRETDVYAGRVTPLLLLRSRSAALGFDLLLRWEAMPTPLRRARFFLTPLRGAGATAAYEAVRGHPLRRRYGDPLRDGPYLLRYPKRGLARRVEASARSGWVVDFTPPRPGFLARGHRTVAVRVTRAGEPLRDLFVGLRMQARTRDPEERWMRYAATSSKGVRFERVPAGWYELLLLDRVLGEEHGVPPRIRKLSVWRDDVEIDWELRDRSR